MPTNRLAAESSPYLLQHANNPVDWYPWGDEAFAEARRRDCPVFVSIGYSTCHWCHVMEHESFADPDIAALMNSHLVCVKIDREERPDLDAHFMHHCQMLTGSGGWPLTVVLTPGGDVFYAGTYFPPDSLRGRIGMLDLVPRLAAAWHEDRERVHESVRQIRSSIERSLEPQPGRAVDAAVADEARDTLARRFDPEWGGFGSAPKFPTPQHLQLLLQAHGRPARTGDLAMAERTLQEMRRGGLYDQAGHGFHRYSTDREWCVPHFEKMLYDQALLVPVYVQAWRLAGRPFYRSVVEETIGFVMRELALPGGGFRSALDADTEGAEGRFHTWTRNSLAEALGTAGMGRFDRLFPLPAEGNWRGESGHEHGLLVLRLPGGPSTGLIDFVHGTAAADEEAAALQVVLRDARDRRVRPFLDDKVLCDWNAMMISALAQAGFALGRPEWLEHAAASARFLLRGLGTADGRLLHRWRAGSAGIPAMLPDHAALVEGLLELYTADGDPSWLAEALRLQETQDRLFLDTKHGGYFDTASDATELPLRRKEAQDGALPSGNSLALANLVRLGRLTGEERWLDQAEALAAWAHGNLPLAQGSSDRLLCGLDELRHPRREIVIQGDPESSGYCQLLEVIVRHWIPGQTLHRLVPAHRDALATMLPWLRDLAMHETEPETARVLVCRNRSCDLPCTTVPDLETSLLHP